MGKRKRSQAAASAQAEAPPSQPETTAADDTELVRPRRQQRQSSSLSSSTSSSSSSSAAAAPAAAMDDDSDDELAVHIIERPAGYVSPSNVSDGDDSSSTGSSESDSEDDDGTASGGLRINRAYAERYEAEKRQLELSKKAQRGRRKSDMIQLVQDELSKHGTSLAALTTNHKHDDDDQHQDEAEDEDDGEDEDDEGVLLTEALDVRIHETLNAIKRKDPAVYDKSRVFFDEADDDGEEEKEAEQEEEKQRGRKEKTVTVKDLLLQSMAADDEESDEEEEPPRPMTHVQEQAALKQSVLEAAGTAQGDEDEDDLFKVRVRDGDTAAASSSSPPSTGVLSSRQFLTSFMSQQWWKQPASSVPSYERIKGEAPPPLLMQPDSEDDEEVERGEEFEFRYNNFRYEEAGSSKVLTYPRDIADSVRRKDERRKQRRQRRKERQAEDRRRTDEELKRLKHDKMTELKQRLQRIADAAGLQADTAARSQLTLDGSWDEAEHDRVMAAMFDEQYYEQGEDDETTIAQLLQDDAADDGRDELRQAQQQGLDELYAMSYEDVISGDLRTRFHYTRVKPDSFGMTVADILSKPDRDLNRHVGLKQLAPYRHDSHLDQEAADQPAGKKARWATKGGRRKKTKTKPKQTAVKAVRKEEGGAEMAAVGSDVVNANGAVSSAQRRRLREKKRKAVVAAAASAAAPADSSAAAG